MKLKHAAVDQMNQQVHSARPTHPGIFLLEELDERGIKPSAFALQLGIYPNAITEVINGKRPITAGLALKLENALSVSATYWMNLQAIYNVQLERQKKVAV